ncbi:MAG: hypothetical protein HY716_17140 [Planctomycetes bacterium]|nr:hypothetical protein [Planctomycetota bacterium]
MKLLTLWFLVLAQDKPAVKIAAVAPEKDQIKIGETVRVAFDLEIPPEWHIYPAQKPLFGKPTIFTFDGGVTAGKIEEPEPKVHKDEILEYDYHEGRVRMVVPMVLRPGPTPGPFEVKGRIDYQICDPNTCIDNSTPFSFPVTVLEGKVTPTVPMESEFDQHGFGGLILLGMLGGLVSLMMPCTYPLIPITLTYFVKQAAGSRSHGMMLSTAYATGIIATFTGLGFLLTLILGAGGARLFAANPWVNIAVGALFLWFGGSLFGWYEIRLPFGLGSKLVGGRRTGVGGAFILGLLFAVVTFTCTIPIAATILSIAAGQHRLAALIAMLFYSATMAAPFFVMGLFPGMIKEVPKSGGWLHTVKVSMAWVELALALFYFSKADQSWEIGVLSRPVMLAVWATACAVVAIYLLGLFRARPRLMRSVFALVFLGFGAFMAYGYTGKPLGLFEIVVPPPTIHGTTLPEALKEAKKLNKPLFVEFTGVT